MDPRLRAALQRRGIASGRDLTAELGVSQPTLSRLVGAAGDAVVPLGRGRSTRYALARPVRGLGSRLPLFRVDCDGSPQRVATLHPLGTGGCLVEAERPLPDLLRGERRSGVFDGLPWFVTDLRPQGFLGRAFARAAAPLGLPADPRLWSDDDTLVGLALLGDDCPGDLIVGEEAARRFYSGALVEMPSLPAESRAEAYPELARKALEGAAPGSSAGGEQPKFTAALRDHPGVRHVIVKFSPAGDTPAAQRWADLLRSEHRALAILRDAGHPASRAEIVEGGGRVFLEVTRFDRTGARGRIGAVSMFALDNEFFGRLDSWRRGAERLAARGWLSTADATEIGRLALFADFIGNTDQHFGNIAFLFGEGGTLRLAPVYDMLPMLYAPVNGEIVPRALTLPPPAPGEEGVWFAAGRLAARYWVGIARDAATSEEFRKIATCNAMAVERALAALGG